MSSKHVIGLMLSVLMAAVASAEITRTAGKRPANMTLPPGGSAPAAESTAAPPSPPPPVSETPKKEKKQTEEAPVALEAVEAAPVDVPAETPAPAAPDTGEPVEQPTPIVGGSAVETPARPPAGTDSPPAVPPEAAPGGDPYLSLVLEELARLREEVLELRQTVDLFSTGLLNNLQEENHRLRRQIKALYDSRYGSVPGVPTPDRTLLEEVLEQPPDTAESTSAENTGAPDKAAETGPPDKEPEFFVIAEWGREPADAQALTPPAASLKGIIGYVNPGTSDEALAMLGRSLRTKFSDYDNINIEVFDDEKAAVDYKKGRPAAEHRVLSISKHRDSQRDVILLIRGELVREIPLVEPANTGTVSR